MEEKTISQLNSKAWYRLLKVIFLLIILIIFVGYNLLVFASIGTKNIDQNKTLVQCSYGDKKTFTPRSLNLNLDKNDFINGIFNYKGFFLGYNEYTIKNIFKECYPAYDFSRPTLSPDIFGIQKVYEVWGRDRLSIKKEDRGSLSTEEIKYLDDTIPKIENSITNTEKAQYLDFNVKLFDIKPIFTHTAFVKYFIFGNLIILICSEIIKRIFYYVILGRVMPR